QLRSETPGIVAALGYDLDRYPDHVDILVGSVMLCLEFRADDLLEDARPCVKDSLRDFQERAAPVVGVFEELEHAEGRCLKHVARIRNRFTALHRFVLNNTAELAASVSGQEIPVRVHRIDAKWARVQAAYAQLNRACGK
ncbi:MAG TPA: hypothetical protein VIT65_17935, partial [Microlunatus sp.]